MSYRGSVTAATRRGGRRPGDSGTRDAILAAARARFAQHGYDRTTIRAVAADAGVDPALVHHFFGTKDGLFARTMQLPLDPAEVVPQLVDAGPREELGERLARFCTGVFREHRGANPMVAMLRSSMSGPGAARMIREFYTQAVLRTVAERLGVPDGELRAALCASQVMGMAVAREVIELPPLVELDDEVLVAAVAPVFQHYLTGPLGSEPPMH